MEPVRDLYKLFQLHRTCPLERTMVMEPTINSVERFVCWSTCHRQTNFTLIFIIMSEALLCDDELPFYLIAIGMLPPRTRQQRTIIEKKIASFHSIWTKTEPWIPMFFRIFSLLPAFLQLGLSNAHVRTDRLLNWSSAAKCAQLLITNLVTALSNTHRRSKHNEGRG